jgi:hypothetical protein
VGLLKNRPIVPVRDTTGASTSTKRESR